MHLIELFVSDHCPACPAARARVWEFATRHPGVRVLVHDVAQQPQLAGRYGLIATPAIVVDGLAILYGVPSLETLSARCARAARDQQRSL